MQIPQKAAAAGLAGAFVTFVVAVMGMFNITVPPEVSAAATTLLGTLATYLTPHNGAAS